MCSYGSGFLIIPAWSWLSVSSKCPLTLDGIWQVPIDTVLQAGRHCERTIQTRPFGVALRYWQAYFKRQLQKGPSTRCFNAGFNSILEFYDSNNSHFLRNEKKKNLEREMVSFFFFFSLSPPSRPISEVREVCWPRTQHRMQVGVCLKCALMTRINLTLQVGCHGSLGENTVLHIH